MSTPYIGFSNDTLAQGEILEAGDFVTCPTCGKEHVLTDSKPPMLLTYRCEEKSYLAAIEGKSVMGRKADVSGTIGE